MTRRSRTGHLVGGQRSEQRSSVESAAPPATRPRLARPLRLVVFAAIVLVVGGGAVGLAVSRLQPPATIDVAALQVHASMAGFEPAALTVKAGQDVRVEFSSMDTSFHSDGGGWHQFAIDELAINWKVGPQSGKVFEFTAPTKPGTYTFYCDICCGGKQNPSMQGTLTVSA